MRNEQRRVWLVIPARGGSKGIPRKNLLKIGGRSLVARAVAAAVAACGIDRVIVTTDDADIAAASRAAGADIVERPPELASDSASTESALLHVLDAEEKRLGLVPDLLVLVQCTSPFVTAADVEGIVARLRDADADSALAVHRSHGFIWRESEGGAVGLNHDKTTRQRRQDMSPEFLETGAVYAMTVSGFRKAKHRFFGKTVLYEMPAARSIEIDDFDDLAQARAQALAMDSGPARWEIPEPLAGIVFDFDGVMTDNRVIVREDGVEAVICHRGDGFGIELALKAGLNLIVMSKETNPVVAARCRKLGIRCIQGEDDKLSTFKAIAAQANSTPDRFIYVGNDINDLECMRAAGLGVAVADAIPAILQEADLVLTRRGGHGAVRELLDGVLKLVSHTRRESLP